MMRRCRAGWAVAWGAWCWVVAFGAAPSPAGSAERPGGPRAAKNSGIAPPAATRIATFGAEAGGPALRGPVSMARDARSGDLFVTCFESGEVLVFSGSGSLVQRLGSGAGLVTPFGVAVDAGGRLFVTELQTGFLKVFDAAGAPLERIDLSQECGRRVAPGRITLGSDGLLYVADLGHDAILVLEAAGNLVRTIASLAYLQKAGPLDADRILATCGQGFGVRIFDRDGTQTAAFGEHGDAPSRNVSFPAGYALDAKGRLWVADAFQHRLKIYGLDGTLLGNIGRMQSEGHGFFFPVDLCFGDAGTLYVLEKGAGRIQVFQVSDLGESGHE